jgi:steroid delta-isomerase-like uncharacterized protein
MQRQQSAESDVLAPTSRTTPDPVLVHRALFDVWNRRAYEEFSELLTDDTTFEDATVGAPLRGVDAYRRFAEGYGSAFPDARFTLGEPLAGGGRVVSEWTVTGTHRGTLAGLAPTGRRVTVRGATVTELRDGKVARIANYWDSASLSRQLGAPVAPQPGSVGAAAAAS